MKKRSSLFLLFFFLTLVSLRAQEIKGRIIDKSNNTPLQGVTITLQGTTVSTQSDASGNFSLTSNAPFPVVLTATYVGFKPFSISVTGPEVGNIELEAVNSTLSDIVVVGYGTVRKRDLVGSVVSVKGSEVRKVAAGNAMESLQGKLPGVDITRTSGPAGIPVKCNGKGQPIYPC